MDVIGNRSGDELDQPSATKSSHVADVGRQQIGRNIIHSKRQLAAGHQFGLARQVVRQTRGSVDLDMGLLLLMFVTTCFVATRMIRRIVVTVH